jgi:hypothetical protein
MISRPSCDVVGCDQPPTGSYLSAGRTEVAEFAVCHTHLAKMKAGRRPVVVEALQAAPDAAPSASLLFE